MFRKVVTPLSRAVVYDYVSYLKNDKTEFEKLQGQQHMALDERARRAEPVSEYASLNSSTRYWEIPTEHVTIEKIVGKGAFGQVAKATVLPKNCVSLRASVRQQIYSYTNSYTHMVCSYTQMVRSYIVKKKRSILKRTFSVGCSRSAIFLGINYLLEITNSF